MIDFFENFRNDFLKKLIKKRTKDKKTDLTHQFFCSSRNKFKKLCIFLPRERINFSSLVKKSLIF